MKGDIQEVNQTVFAHLLETGGIGSESRARQDASKASYFGSMLSSSARSYLVACKQRTLRPVSEVADIETRLVHPVFQHRHRHCEARGRVPRFFFSEPETVRWRKRSTL